MGEREKFLQDASKLLDRYSGSEDLVICAARVITHYLKQGECEAASDFIGALASNGVGYARMITRQTLSRISSG